MMFLCDTHLFLYAKLWQWQQMPKQVVQKDLLYPIKYWLKIIKANLSKSNLCETFGKDNKYIQLTGQPSFKNNQMSRLPAPATDILNQLKTKENLFCNAQISVYKRIPAERIFYCGKLNTSEAAVQNYSEAAFHDVL